MKSRLLPYGPTLIAVSLHEWGESRMFPPFGLCKRAIVNGSSTTQKANFTFETAFLGIEQTRSFELLEDYGFTVVEAPTDWRYTDSEQWQSQVIQEAIKNVIANARNSEGQTTMSGYNVELAQLVLEVANKHFPKQLSLLELKHDLSPEPDDEALMTALDALLIHKHIEGPHIRTGIDSTLRAVIQIRITKAGQDHILSHSRPAASPNGHIIHGDQINNYGHVGAMGRHSEGVVHVHDRWSAIASQIDLPALTAELAHLITEFRKVAASREDDKQLALLGNAADEADKGNSEGMAANLSRMGKNVLAVAQKIGTDIAAKVIVELTTG